jgi:glycosyltransferase involved in cell wall biosynthesis
MRKILTVSIGIAAYNEERNIRRLLGSILKQKISGFEIESIIVVSDHSDDKTDMIVKELIDNGSKIVLIKNEQRQGQAYSQNRIFETADSDMVVLFEADTELTDNFLTDLLAPLIKNPGLGLVQGNVGHVLPRTFFGRVLSKQKSIYHNFTISHPAILNYFTTGRSESVYKVLKWPKNVPEDVYAHLWCMTNKIRVAFSGSAVCLFKVPETVKDLYLERLKYNSGPESLKEFFPEQLVKRVYDRTSSQRFLMIIKFLFENPVLFFVYEFINFFLIISPPRRKFYDLWAVGSSTKLL